MATFAQATTPFGYRGTEIAGCLNGVTTYKNLYYCDPATGPVPGSGTTTDNVSFFYQIAADGTHTVIDYATAAASWVPGPCADVAPIAVGVITNPDDPVAVDIPVAVVAQPDGTFKYISLADGSEITLAAGQEFRVNADGYDIERITGCIKDAQGVTVRSGVEVVIVTDEDSEEVTRTVLDTSTGAIITLAAGEVFGPCSGGLPSEVTCGCLVDETNGTVRPAVQEVPRDADSGLVDWAAVTYNDGAGTVLTKLATEVFTCGSCPKVINC